MSHSDTMGNRGKVGGPEQSGRSELGYSKVGLGRGLIFENFGQSGLIEVPEMNNPAHVLILRSGSPSVVEWSRDGRHQRAELPAGSVSLVPMGFRHAAKVFRPLPGVASILQIHPEFFQRGIGEISKSGRVELIQHMDLNDPQIVRLVESLRAEIADGLPAGSLFGESVGLALSAHIAHRYSASAGGLETHRGGLSRSRLNRVHEYIDAHLADNLDLQALADVAGLNMHHFARAFKQSTGEAPHRFVLRKRVERAKQLLCHSQVPVIEASVRTGFVDQSHFSKVFRRMVGLSPTEFRSS